MYSGFITAKRTLPAVGVHQRFDTAAYRMVSSYFAEGTFPTLRQILHFEGINGPDGLKVKSPGKHEPSHLYNPENQTGPIPELIAKHYDRMVEAVKDKDMVRTAFEAAWMAHYICDGLTPAHHFPLQDRLAEHTTGKTPRGGYSVRQSGESTMEAVRKGWAIWGGKGLLTTHFNFEIGVATVLLGQKIQVRLDMAKLAEAKQVGAASFFKQEAKEIAGLHLYERFVEKGWTSDMARVVKAKLAPQITQTIGIMWLLAYLEAGQELALQAAGEN